MPRNQLPANPETLEVLQHKFDFVNAFPSAARLWDRVFIASEREQLGGDLETAYRDRGPIGMWMHLHGVTQLRALVEIAYKLDMLSENDYVWLLREIEEDVNNTPPSARPHWDHILGKLHFGGKVIRWLRITKSATNIQKILDAFQKANWALRILNPLTRGPEQLHQALRSLNFTLKRIHFHALEGGNAVRWSIV